MPYLFLHFREKSTPDGEQVYFGVSPDGFRWESLNGGAPLLGSYWGRFGARDHAGIRTDDGFVILSTDLSLSYHIRGDRGGENLWQTLSRRGSRCLSKWTTPDLVNFSKQTLVEVAPEGFGCVWAPDINRLPGDDYMVHFSASNVDNGWGSKAIYYVTTSDFVSFSDPKSLYRDPSCDIIDSAMFEYKCGYYLFLKSADAGRPSRPRLLRGDSPTGPFEPIPAFDLSMEKIEYNLYEGPTGFFPKGGSDGEFVLFLDYYGRPGPAQGYRAFVGDIETGVFEPAKPGRFSFPYGYKHGTVIQITDEEYARLREHDFSDKGWV